MRSRQYRTAERRESSRIKVLFALLGLLSLHGCAPAPPAPEAGPAFYPPLPNPPRIQHLVSLATADDFADPPSKFAEFVVGKEGKQPIVTKPYGIALFEGKMYVVDIRGAGYAVIDLETGKRTFIASSGAGAMKKPINITIDRDGTKYITDTKRKQVLAFDRNDRFVRAYGVEGQFKPSDVAVLGDRLYVADLKNKLIQVLDKRSGELLFRMATADSPDTAVHFPTNLAFSEASDLYVSDTGNFRVLRFDPDGGLVGSYGGVGKALGRFARPKGVAVDRAGRIYVTDAAFENIQVFSDDGKLLLFFGEPGSRPENINLPADLEIDYEHARFFQRYAAPGFNLENTSFW